MTVNLMNPEDYGSVYTRKVAMHCLWLMHRYGRFEIGSIINVGVGSAPEYAIWRWICPSIPILGIDIRQQAISVLHRNEEKYIQAVAHEKTMIVNFCSRCGSLQCKSQNTHEKYGLWKKVKAVAIDDLVKDPFCKPPYFIWMDIDGGEILALKGAKETLRNTGWICVELTNWVPSHIKHIVKLLGQNGFNQVARFSKDGIFRNTKFLRRRRGK